MVPMQRPSHSAAAMKVLNVAEKPSVAKSLAALLGRGQSRRREGRSQYNKVFECESVQVPSLNRQVTMVITSVSGHLMEMDFADSHRSAQLLPGPPRPWRGGPPSPARPQVVELLRARGPLRRPRSRVHSLQSRRLAREAGPDAQRGGPELRRASPGVRRRHGPAL